MSGDAAGEPLAGRHVASPWRHPDSTFRRQKEIPYRRNCRSVLPCVMTRRYPLALLFASLVSCHDNGSRTTDPGGAPEPLVLSVLMVSLDHVEGFGPFGESLGGTRQSPAWTIITSNPLDSVFAVAPGVVEEIELNDPARPDREIHTRGNRSQYKLIYDHVEGVAVSKGSVVAAGTYLGHLAAYIGGKGWVELQINDEHHYPPSFSDISSSLAVCPLQFGTPAFNAAHQAAYDRAPLHPGGLCLANTVVP